MVDSLDMPLFFDIERGKGDGMSMDSSLGLEGKQAPLIRTGIQFFTLLEPALLVLLVAALSARYLLRLENALGARLLHELRTHEAYRQLWLKLLAAECGLRLAGLTCCASPLRLTDVETQREYIPPLAATKAIVRLARASMAHDGGWRCDSVEELSFAATALWHLDVSNADGREILDPDTGRVLGTMQRLAFAHFDLKGCFADLAWDDLVDRFQTGEGIDPLRPSFINSSHVHIDIDNLSIPFSLQLGTLGSHGPESGFFLHMDLKELDRYYEDKTYLCSRSIWHRQKDYLRVVCVLRCGMNIERRECALLVHEHVPMRDSYGSHIREYSVFWWFDADAQGIGHVLSLEIRRLDESGEEIEAFVVEDLGNAQWNLALNHGTDSVELAFDEDNAFGKLPFAPGALEGKIALIRRGGGCGFAQKVLAASEAGAVGCIIYEGIGDRESMGGVQVMGQNFQGHRYPDPGIPSVLVDSEVGQRLLDMVSRPGAGFARINIDRSMQTLRHLPQDFENFRKAAGSGEPVHLAILVERIEPVATPLSMPRLAWFESSSSSSLQRFSPLLARRSHQR